MAEIGKLVLLVLLSTIIGIFLIAPLGNIIITALFIILAISGIWLLKSKGVK